MNERILEWFERNRGIRKETLHAFGCTEFEGGVRFPYPSNQGKTRYGIPDGERSFRSERGSILGLFNGDKLGGGRVVFLVEGETDTLRLQQELWDSGSDAVAVGLPGIETWRSEYAALFKESDAVFVILDNDADYRTMHRVTQGRMAIRKDIGPKAKQIYLPKDVKDVCEFFDKYDIETLHLLAERRQGSWHYEALDLTKPAPPPDWLVKDLICKGDICMMIGEPGVGKSWLSMALAVSTVTTPGYWLGQPVVPASSRVLYVDEENPEPLIRIRLKALGLTDAGSRNIRYLHSQAIRLDRNPELLLDEALDWEPGLIVLDSLTRLHTSEENNAGEVAKLFNDGIVPLSREVGATVLILHHVNKSEAGSSFVRARGSGDMSGVIDTGLDVRKGGQGISIHHYKSRWVETGTILRARIEDVEGGVAIVTHKPEIAF